MTKIAIKGMSLRILFAFKPERLLKGETRKRRDLFPRCKRFFLDRTPLSHSAPSLPATAIPFAFSALKRGLLGLTSG